MQKRASILSLLIIILAAIWGFYDLSPSGVKTPQTSTDFSINNALSHLKEISKEPHHTGTEAHKTVQNYIVSEYYYVLLLLFPCVCECASECVCVCACVHVCVCLRV